MNLALYIDRFNGTLVKSNVDATPVSLPPFYQGGVLHIDLYVLVPNPSGGITAPYSVQDLTTKGVRVGLGRPEGAATPIAYTSAFNPISGPPSGVTGTLSLQTQAFDDFLGDALEREAFLEVDVSYDGTYWDKILQIPVRCRAALLHGVPDDVVGPFVLVDSNMSPYTVPNNARTVLVEGDAPVTLKLDAGGYGNGQILLVKDISGGTALPITINPAPGYFDDWSQSTPVIINDAWGWLRAVYYQAEGIWCIESRTGGGGAAMDEGKAMLLAQVFGR